MSPESRASGPFFFSDSAFCRKMSARIDCADAGCEIDVMSNADAVSRQARFIIFPSADGEADVVGKRVNAG